MNETYKIYTQSPMGRLDGFLKLKKIENELFGSIIFNGKNFDFQKGQITGNKFKFNGSMRAYFKKINYTAEGEICNENINILVNTNIGNFKIEGKRA